MTRPAPILTAVGIAAFAFAIGFGVRALMQSARQPTAVQAKGFSPRPDSDIPSGPLGEAITLGRTIFTDTANAAPQYVGNDLKCSNCHLDGGRRPNTAPLWAAYGMFPQYRKKNGHMNTFAERVQECFKYSMNGRVPPPDDPVIVAIESYAAFLAKGAPQGVKMPGQGYPKLAPPTQPPDFARGRAVFAASCARCHGADGAGQRADGQVLFPPLWGERSYNWGAGMSDMQNAAAFIATAMPQDKPGSLTDQQAWDLAAYIDSQPRPQDPRYAGSVADTRARYHSSGQSAYGTVVEGVLLGGDGPPRRAVRRRPS